MVTPVIRIEISGNFCCTLHKYFPLLNSIPNFASMQYDIPQTDMIPTLLNKEFEGIHGKTAVLLGQCECPPYRFFFQISLEPKMFISSFILHPLPSYASVCPILDTILYGSLALTASGAIKLFCRKPLTHREPHQIRKPRTQLKP